eukprot:s2843_g3.t1
MIADGQPQVPSLVDSECKNVPNPWTSPVWPPDAVKCQRNSLRFSAREKPQEKLPAESGSFPEILNTTSNRYCIGFISIMAPAGDLPLPLQIQITATEERSSMLKSWSVYLLEVNDFGRKFILEKRFDDFNQLHADLKEIEPGMPPLPEKKFMASTDASVVAERKPAFEKILRYLLRSDAVVHEKGQTLFKFLELPTAAVVAFRYLFKTQRISSARQCGKLTDPKLEKEAYRLGHPAVVKTCLRLLEEGALKDPEQEAKAADVAAFAAAAAEAEIAVVEMLRFALASGNEATRQFFLQEKGLGVLLRYIFRKGKKEPGTGPDQRARGVLNALIKVEADHFPAVMADFLQKGGILDFQEGLDLLQCSGFADFISKLLWIAWDIQVQQVFFAEAHRLEALGLLSKLFVCPSKGARVCAGLLLANALCHAQLGDREREAQAAQGLRQLTEEMACCGESQEAEDQEVRTFVAGLGQSAERFTRILTCAQAPWQQHNGQLPDEEHPLWAGATFSLWCLLRMRPDPARLADLRPALPAVAQGGPPRARWLAGELLLQLQLQVSAQLPSPNSPEAIVEMNIQERGALEFALQEMFEHTRSGLHSQLSESSQVIETQQRLIEERQQPLPIASNGSTSDGWHQPLEAALAKLKTTRQELSSALADAERQRQSAETAVREVLEMDNSDLSQAEDQAMDQQLQSMRQTEAEYLARCHEQDQQSSALRSQEEQVATANAAMENAEKVLQEMRSRIASYEADISTRQRDVQNKRTMASSDMQAARNHLSMELEQIKQKQTKLRERALQLQAEMQGDGSSDASKEMDRLKVEAGRLKGRAAELTQELQAASVDPQQLEQQASAAESAVQHLAEQRDQLRGELQGLEEEHSQARSEWQQAVSSLQHARQEKEVADLQSSSLRRQLEGQWASWHPLWSKRLQAWRLRSQALARAARGAEMLAKAAQKAWDGLRREAELRHQTLADVEALQHQLAALAHDLSSIEDSILH